MALRSTVSASDFAEKLKLTAVALNYFSQKDLAAAFYAVNPRTDFTVSRSYKWTQGRTVPRSSRLYSDWAKLLDLDKSAQELLSCSVDQFQGWITARHGPLPSVGSLGAAPSLARPGGLVDPTGHFACYFPEERSGSDRRIVRASMTIQRSRGLLAHTAHLARALGTGCIQENGVVRIYRQIACIELRNRVPGRVPTYLTLSDPNSSGSVLVGIMLSASAVESADPMPEAIRFVAVRIPCSSAGKLHASNRMLAAGTSLAADLATLGLAIEAAPDLNSRLAGILNTADGADGLGAACQRVRAASRRNPSVSSRRLYVASSDQFCQEARGAFRDASPGPAA